MKIIDCTGPLTNGMWSFGAAFPVFNLREVSGESNGFGEFHYTCIEGLHSLSGTYIETPAHALGHDKSYLINDVPLERLVNRDAVVINLHKDIDDFNNRAVITLQDILQHPNSAYVRKGDALIIGCGWEKYWMDNEHFFACSPYFSNDAMMWILDKKPSILATDTPAWDNYDNPSGFFSRFYAQNILMVVPLINLAGVTKPRVKLTVLPMKVENSCGAPCRAFIMEE